jgi:hypothetical protein
MRFSDWFKAAAVAQGHNMHSCIAQKYREQHRRRGKKGWQ